MGQIHKAGVHVPTLPETRIYLDLVNIVDSVVEFHGCLLVVGSVLCGSRSHSLRRRLVHISRRVDGGQLDLRDGRDRRLVSAAWWHVIGRLVIVRRRRRRESLRDDNRATHLCGCMS